MGICPVQGFFYTMFSEIYLKYENSENTHCCNLFHVLNRTFSLLNSGRSFI